MCASGVGRKFEVRWNGLESLTYRKACKPKKVIVVSKFETPPPPPTPMYAKYNFSLVALGELATKIF